MNQTRKITLCILTFLAVLSSCAGGRAWTRQDSWYSSPSRQLPKRDQLDASQVSIVNDSGLTEAIALLQDAPAVELNWSSAARFASNELPQSPDRIPYLVRGVYLNPSHFTVRQSEGVVHVDASSLGLHAVPMKRRPVIVLLHGPPTEVYVTCSMAE